MRTKEKKCMESVPLLEEKILFPGLILNMSTKGSLSWLVRAVFHPVFKKLKEVYAGVDIFPEVCPNHDAMIVKHKGRLAVGESVPPFARIVSLEEYNKRVIAGDIISMRVLSPLLNPASCEMAADWWLKNVAGRIYDFRALPLLGIKALLVNFMPKKVAGWEWAYWCTEGIAQAYLQGAGKDVWEKSNPTPYTTMKRSLENRLQVFE